MADPMTILQPNSMGDMLENTGLEEMLANRGLGVAEVSRPAAMESKNTLTAPKAEKERLRVAKAREFGMTKETVGF
jgi:hypothetical protein